MSDFDRDRNLNRDARLRSDNNFGWGIPAAVIAAVLIIGGLWYANSGTHVTTASNDRAPVTQTAPKQPTGTVTPAPVTPAPTTPAPTPKQ